MKKFENTTYLYEWKELKEVVKFVKNIPNVSVEEVNHENGEKLLFYYSTSHFHGIIGYVKCNKNDSYHTLNLKMFGYPYFSNQYIHNISVNMEDCDDNTLHCNNISIEDFKEKFSNMIDFIGQLNESCKELKKMSDEFYAKGVEVQRAFSVKLDDLKKDFKNELNEE